MITQLIVDGVLKLVSIRKDSNKSKRIARVFDPRATTPEAVLKEIGNNVFVDDVHDKYYKLTKEGMSLTVGM